MADERRVFTAERSTDEPCTALGTYGFTVPLDYDREMLTESLESYEILKK